MFSSESRLIFCFHIGIIDRLVCVMIHKVHGIENQRSMRPGYVRLRSMEEMNN